MSLSIFSNTNAAIPGEGLMSALQTPIDNHAAWQFIERVTGTGTSPSVRYCDVYKCLGSVNSFGTDFFVGVCRTTDTSDIGFMIAEQYDSTAKTFNKAAVWATATGSTITPGSDGSYTTARHVANENTLVAATQGFLFATGGYPTSTSGIRMPPAYGQPCMLSVTNDRIVFSAGPYIVYAGLYDPFYNSTIDPFPLVVGAPPPLAGITGTLVSNYLTNPIMAFTREYPTGGVMNSAYWGAVDSPWLAPPPSATALYSKDPITNSWQMSRLRVASGSRRCVAKGLLKSDLMYMRAAELQEGVGDTITVGGVGYTCIQVDNQTLGNFSTNNLGSLWVPTAA